MLKPGTGWINVHVSKNGTFKLRNGIHQDVLGLFQDYFYRFCLYLCFFIYNFNVQGTVSCNDFFLCVQQNLPMICLMQHRVAHHAAHCTAYIFRCIFSVQSKCALKLHTKNARLMHLVEYDTYFAGHHKCMSCSRLYAAHHNNNQKSICYRDLRK